MIKVSAGSGRLLEPTLEKVILILTAHFSVPWLTGLQGWFGSFFMSNTFSAFSIPAWRLLSLCHCTSFSNSSSLSRLYSTFPHITFALLILFLSLSFCCYFTFGSLVFLCSYSTSPTDPKLPLQPIPLFCRQHLTCVVFISLHFFSCSQPTT